MLKIRNVALDTTPENTVFPLRQCRVYRAEVFAALKKIEISGGHKNPLPRLVIYDVPLLVAGYEALVANAFRSDGVLA